MLSGEGNAAERWKTTICLSSKKATLQVRHTFFAHFFVVVLYDYNVKLPRKRLSYTRSRRKYCTCSRSFFFTAVYFHLALVACSISYFLTAATKLSCCSSNKKMSPFLFISHSKSLSPLFSLDFAGLPPSFFFVSIFLLLYFPNLWTWQLN